MSFKVESENLRSQAEVWADRAADVTSATSNIGATIGAGDKFGFMAGSQGVEAMYNAWTSDISHAMTDAVYSFNYLDAALTSTADEYDEADATSAAGSTALDNMMDEGEYHHD